jgi:hypothetical protein
MLVKAMVQATAASTIQISSHFCVDCLRAKLVASKALAPTNTCPQPDTAVNDEERSIVWRMNFKSSIARTGGGPERGRRRKLLGRCSSIAGINYIKFFMIQSEFERLNFNEWLISANC